MVITAEKVLLEETCFEADLRAQLRQQEQLTQGMKRLIDSPQYQQVQSLYPDHTFYSVGNEYRPRVNHKGELRASVATQSRDFWKHGSFTMKKTRFESSRGCPTYSVDIVHKFAGDRFVLYVRPLRDLYPALHFGYPYLDAMKNNIEILQEIGAPRAFIRKAIARMRRVKMDRLTAEGLQDYAKEFLQGAAKTSIL